MAIELLNLTTAEEIAAFERERRRVFAGVSTTRWMKKVADNQRSIARLLGSSSGEYALWNKQLSRAVGANVVGEYFDQMRRACNPDAVRATASLFEHSRRLDGVVGVRTAQRLLAPNVGALNRGIEGIIQSGRAPAVVAPRKTVSRYALTPREICPPGADHEGHEEYASEPDRISASELLDEFMREHGFDERDVEELLIERTGAADHERSSPRIFTSALPASQSSGSLSVAPIDEQAVASVPYPEVPGKETTVPEERLSRDGVAFARVHDGNETTVIDRSGYRELINRADKFSLFIDEAGGRTVRSRSSGGARITLTDGQFRMLVKLVQAGGPVCIRQLRAVPDQSDGAARTMLKELRKKLRSTLGVEGLIQTTRGGASADTRYSFNPPDGFRLAVVEVIDPAT